MSERMRRTAWYLAVMFFSGSLFTACSGISISGGLLGSVLSFLGILVLVLSISTTQTSCDVKPCLSIAVPQDGKAGDGGVNKDTPDARVGPCLTAPPPDRRSEPVRDRDAPVGPCLSPPPPDTGGKDIAPRDVPPDVKVGPCLSQPPPDAGTKEGAKDAPIGPCLSPPQPDRMGMNNHNDIGGTKSVPTKLANRADQRDDAIARLKARGILPPDVAARLGNKLKNKG